MKNKSDALQITVLLRFFVPVSNEMSFEHSIVPSLIDMKLVHPELQNNTLHAEIIMNE